MKFADIVDKGPNFNRIHLDCKLFFVLTLKSLVLRRLRGPRKRQYTVKEHPFSGGKEGEAI